MAAIMTPAVRPVSSIGVDPREVIALEAGTWDALIRMHSATGGRRDQITTGVQINELRSDGLWMLNRLTVKGGAYEGTGIWGFDAKTGHYSGAWADNGSRRIRHDEGRWDPATRTMTWTSMIERADGSVLEMLATSRFIGNRRIYKAYAISGAGELPLVTIVFTRRRD